MEEKRGTYVIENETRVNRILIRVCLALLIFPPLAAVARWKLQYSALDYTDIIVIGIGLVLVIGLAMFLFHRDQKSIVVKYVLLIGLHLGVCYAGTKIEINMFMAYALVPAMSCLYFSKWYTIRLGEVCYCMMLVSLGLRSAVEAEHASAAAQGKNQITSFEWFGVYGFRMTIEYLFMFVILLILVSKIEDTILGTQAKTRQMRKMQNQLITGFANFLESKDENTGFHIRRTADYARMIAEELVRQGAHTDELTPKFIEDLIIAAPLHDAGKVYIPDAI